MLQTCSNFNGIFLLCTRKISPQNLRLQFKIFFLSGLGGLPTSQPKLRCQQIWVEISIYYNPWSSPTFIPNHFPLLATFVHSLMDNFLSCIQLQDLWMQLKSHKQRMTTFLWKIKCSSTLHLEMNARFFWPNLIDFLS